MHIQKGILTTLLFAGYVILWYIKRRDLLKTESVDANVIFKSKKPVQKYFSFLEKSMTATIVLIIPAHIFFYGYALVTSPMITVNYYMNDIIGFLTGVAGLSLCRIAQVTIGKSWRVGIDESAKPGLVTDGIYSYIRNPTYTGLYMLCAGVWIIITTPLFSFWFLAFFIMMEFQVRCEEEYLEQQYGEAYTEYFSRSKRYLPFLV